MHNLLHLEMRPADAHGASERAVEGSGHSRDLYGSWYVAPWPCPFPYCMCRCSNRSHELNGRLFLPLCSFVAAAVFSYEIQNSDGVCLFPPTAGWVKTRMGGEGAILEPDVSIGGVSTLLPRLGILLIPLFFPWTPRSLATSAD